jgi:2'-5' RNA ligase
MHLTLAFLGEIADEATGPIIEAISPSIEIAPFSAVFREPGVFPTRGAPRVLWIGVEEGADKVIEVQRQVAERLRRLGVPLEKRAFHPHLTVARWTKVEEKSSGGRVARAIRKGNSPPPVRPIRLPVRQVTLFQSRLSPAGSRYTPLAHATLT